MMKIKLYFIILLFLFVACSEIEKEKRKKVVSSEKNTAEDSTLYKIVQDSHFFSTSGTYARQQRTPENMLTICEYKRKIKMPFVSDTLINFLVKNDIIPSVMHYTKRDAEAERIPYEKNIKKDSVTCCYYETINFGVSDEGRSKVIGKLYEIWRYKGTIAGAVFLSDTTEKYGSFVLIMPPILKPPANYPEHWKVPKLPYIKSLDPKASVLEGNYTKFAPAYRIIKDEELPKKH